MQKIGFIGVGTMGNPMARNLLQKGYDVTVYDVADEKIKDMITFGAKGSSSPKEAAKGSDFVITMLPSSPHVEEAVSGKDGILEGIKEGAIYIDMSTIDPITTKKIEKMMSEKSVMMLDAPVARGRKAAVEGTLTLFIGGKKESFEKARNVLEAMGTNLLYMGETGSGAVTKLVNNLCSASIVVAYAEAFVFGAKAGVSPEKLLEAIEAGSGASSILNRHIRDCALKRKFDDQFTADYIMKDLELAMKTAKEFKIPLLLAALSHEIYGMLRAKGEGKGFYPEVIKVFEDYAGIEVRI